MFHLTSEGDGFPGEASESFPLISAETGSVPKWEYVNTPLVYF